MLRPEAPQIRTVEDIHRKSEQIMDAMERGEISPKTAEQMNTTVKGLRWPTEVAIRLMQMQVKGKGNLPPVSPHVPIVRQLLGLPPASGESSRAE